MFLYFHGWQIIIKHENIEAGVSIGQIFNLGSQFLASVQNL